MLIPVLRYQETGFKNPDGALLPESYVGHTKIEFVRVTLHYGSPSLRAFLELILSDGFQQEQSMFPSPRLSSTTLDLFFPGN